MKASPFIFMALLSFQLRAQAPVVTAVAPLTPGTTGQVVITGSGFSSNTTQLVVLFDNVRAPIVSSTIFSIVATVPPQAHLGNVEVINLSTGLSGVSPLKHMQSYGGSTFVGSKVSAATSFASTVELFDMCTCDFDLDGKPDLAANKSKTMDDPTATDIVMLKNNSAPGTLSFTQSLVPAGNTMFNLNCGDLDGDGKPDLVATRAGGTRNVVLIMRNTNTAVGTMSFGGAQSLFLDANQVAVRVAIRDLNQDGKPELIVSNSFDDPATDNILYVFVNQSTPGSISFVATPLKFTVTGAATSYGLDVQDLDGDQMPDVVLTQFNTNDLFVMRNTSSGAIGFAAPLKITSTAFYVNVGTADFNKDGLLDLMATSNFDNSAHVFINQSSSGNLSFKAPIILTTSSSPWGVDASDVDGDGDADLIVANKGGDNLVNVFTSNGAAAPTFTRVDVATPKGSRNIRVTDLDGDAKPDFAFTAVNNSVTQFSADIIRNANCVFPTILNASPSFVCAGTPVVLNTVPYINTTIDWMESGAIKQSGTNPAYSATVAGNYTVRVTGESGTCSQSSSTFSIGADPNPVPADPSILVTPTAIPPNLNPTVCVGSSVGLSTPVVSGTYLWTGPAGFSSNQQSPTISSISAAQSGLYTLQVSVGNCKSNVISKMIDVVAFPSFAIVPSTALPACVSGVTLSVANVPGYSYQWKQNGTAIPGQTSASLSVVTESDYSVVLTNTLYSCSMETSRTNVQLLAFPIPGFTTSATGCTLAGHQFSSTATSDLRGSPVYSWDFGDTGTGLGANVTHIYSVPGSMTVTQTVGYAGLTGCSASTSKGINILTSTIPSIVSSISQSCPGESATMTAIGSFQTLTWNTGATTTSIVVTSPGTYSVSTKDPNGCAGGASFTIAPKPVPVILVTADRTTLKQGESVQLIATGASSYNWTPTEGLDNPQSNSPIATPLASITYNVEGTLTGGCRANTSIDLVVSASASVQPPPLFTPNGDGDNDLWVIKGIENFPECTLQIFDAHGSLVYERMGYTNDWDGTHAGRQLPELVYYYILSCSGATPITGTVLIKR